MLYVRHKLSVFAQQRYARNQVLDIFIRVYGRLPRATLRDARQVDGIPYFQHRRGAYNKRYRVVPDGKT